MKRCGGWYTKAKGKWYRRRIKQSYFKGTYTARCKLPYPKLFRYEMEMYSPRALEEAVRGMKITCGGAA